MKGVLSWAKSNLIIVIALVLMVVAIPVALFFSGKMNTSIREDVSSGVSKAMNDLKGANVSYEIEQYHPDAQPISVSMVPNEAANERAADLQRVNNEDAAAVKSQIVGRNEDGKEILVSGLFPEPATTQSRVRLTQELVNKWVLIHEELLNDHHAGMPPEREDVVADLQAYRQERRSELLADRVSQQLTPDESRRLQQDLTDRRLALYKQAAEENSFYASVDAFPIARPWPENAPPPSLERVWDWQFSWWVHQDVVRAIGEANTDGVGDWMPVTRAPVKQLVELSVDPMDLDANRSSGGGGGGFGGPAQTQPTPYDIAHTGRMAWPEGASDLYDIRYVTLRVVMDSSRIPTLVDAIVRENFMTVIDLDVTDFDEYEALDDGFYMGGDHLVTVSMRIETVWLREWTKQYMPPTVRRTLGIPDEQPQQDGGEPVEDDEQM